MLYSVMPIMIPFFLLLFFFFPSLSHFTTRCTTPEVEAVELTAVAVAVVDDKALAFADVALANVAM